MKKLLDFLKESNHYKHLIGGFVISILSLSAFNAIYSAIVAASCLELKDKLHGGKWDWIDWLLTVLGGAISYVIYITILLVFGI